MDTPAKKRRGGPKVGTIQCKTAFKNGWREEGNTSDCWQDHKAAWLKTDPGDRERLAYPPPSTWRTENPSSGAEVWHALSLAEKKRHGTRTSKRKSTPKPAAAKEPSGRPTTVLTGMMAHKQDIVDVEEAVDAKACPAKRARPYRKHTRGTPTEDSTIDYRVGWLETGVPLLFQRAGKLCEQAQHAGEWTTTVPLLVYTDLPKKTLGRVCAGRPCPRVWTFSSPDSSGPISELGTRQADKRRPAESRVVAYIVMACIIMALWPIYLRRIWLWPMYAGRRIARSLCVACSSARLRLRMRNRS